MILIAHRGNTNGPRPELENHPDYIDAAIAMGYKVEIDLRFLDGKWFLGHDKGQYEVSLKWLEVRKHDLYIHCKNMNALVRLQKSRFHTFWHENDDFTLTSAGVIWAYPGQEIDSCKTAIAVMPETANTNLKNYTGICSDYVSEYKTGPV